MLKSNLFKIIVAVLISLLLISITTIVVTMKIVPIKYMIVGISFLSIITIALIILLFKKNKTLIKVLSIIYIIIEIILLIISLNISNKTFNTISKLTNIKYETVGYSVITLKNNSSDIVTYKNKNMGIIKDMDYSKEVEKEINKKIKVKYIKSDNLADVIDKLLTNNIEVILIKSSYLDVLEESDAKVLEQIKTIYTFDINVIAKDIKKDVNVELDPFTILISGIDVSGSINTVSRSDVNIIMTINPKTYQILLVHIPRDYFVFFHGLGTKDKLTHTGIYGIDMTVQTIEDFMGIDINYYIRINFSTVTKLIDLLGDIEVYNPVAFTNWGVRFNEGNITLNSRQALTFSRSRKMLVGGDLDRGKNQERVLGAIIEKMSNPNVTKRSYEILDVMSNSFVTNMPSESLQTLIKFELDRLPNWKVESYNLNGTAMMTKGTPFYPYYALYVVDPDVNTINTAKAAISNIINIK